MCMRPDERDLESLDYILLWCKKIEGYKELFGSTAADFSSNEMYRDLCSFAFIQIGEAVNNLSEPFVLANPDIPWRRIYGMRCFVTHAYDNANFLILWETIEDNLPELKEFCEQQLSK